jgi:thioredoxin reductase (NADPH)
MKYDTIIIGAGVTGYGAAMYAGRLGLKTLVIGEAPGGTITLTDRVENYPGFIKLTGQELADNLRKHAEDYKDFVSFKEERR